MALFPFISLSMRLPFPAPVRHPTQLSTNYRQFGVKGEKRAIRVKQLVGAQKIVTEQGFVEKAFLEPCRGKIAHRHFVLSLVLRQGNVVKLTTFSYSATGKSTFCRSPCMVFLPPSGGVFRLSFSGSSPGIPCRRSCGFQGATGKTATKKAVTKQTSPAFAFSGRSC